MAGDLSYTDIMEVVESLHRDFSGVRDQAAGRYDLYAMRREPYVPGDIAREGKFRINSPLLINAARTIRADLMMNPTEFMVIPLARERDGGISRVSEQKADNLERALAVIWGRLNEGRRIDHEVIWHQLVSPYGIMVLEFNEYTVPDQLDWMDDETYAAVVDAYERQWMPWSVHTPDPMTCSWLERGGQPKLFARKYKMQVRDVEELFSKTKYSDEPDKKLRLIEDSFRWVSDDYADSYTKNSFKEVDVLYLDDGDYIYQAVCGLSGTGMRVACVPNPTGRPTAFIIPGNVTPSRDPVDKYEPFLLDLMQNVMQTNDIRSTRATAARNLAGPHTYIPINPEIQKLYIQRGEKMPTAHRWNRNETPYLQGEVFPMPSELSVDWDKLEMGIKEEQSRLLPSPFVHIVDPNVLKAATATSILHAAESGLRMYGPLMTAYDAAVRDMMEFGIVGSIQWYFEDLEMYAFASGDELARGKSLKQGSVYRINRKAVDFPKMIMVKTRGMSQAQAAAQYELVERQWILPDGSKGPAAFDDLLDAANYPDRTAQKVKLAVEGFLSAIDPWLQEMALWAVREQIAIDSGMELPIGNMMGQAMGGGGTSPGSSPQQPSGIPGGSQQRMASPMLVGPEGGTDSTQMSGTV